MIDSLKCTCYQLCDGETCDPEGHHEGCKLGDDTTSTYRVFVTRHFIDVTYFDVEASTPRKACNIAKSAAKKLRNSEESRARATDNLWQTALKEVTPLPHLGYSSTPFKPVFFHKTKAGKAYQDERHSN